MKLSFDTVLSTLFAVILTVEGQYIRRSPAVEEPEYDYSFDEDNSSLQKVRANDVVQGRYNHYLYGLGGILLGAAAAGAIGGSKKKKEPEKTETVEYKPYPVPYEDESPICIVSSKRKTTTTSSSGKKSKTKYKYQNKDQRSARAFTPKYLRSRYATADDYTSPSAPEFELDQAISQNPSDPNELSYELENLGSLGNLGSTTTPKRKFSLRAGDPEADDDEEEALDDEVDSDEAAEDEAADPDDDEDVLADELAYDGNGDNQEAEDESGSASQTGTGSGLGSGTVTNEYTITQTGGGGSLPFRGGGGGGGGGSSGHGGHGGNNHHHGEDHEDHNDNSGGKQKIKIKQKSKGKRKKKHHTKEKAVVNCIIVRRRVHTHKVVEVENTQPFELHQHVEPQPQAIVHHIGRRRRSLELRRRLSSLKRTL